MSVCVHGAPSFSPFARTFVWFESGAGPPPKTSDARSILRVSILTSIGRSVHCSTYSLSHSFSFMTTCARPNESAGVVPGLTTIASSAFVAVAEYSQSMTTILVPLSLASVSQCASGIFVVIQFIPHTTTVRACSTALRSNSTVCCPVTIGCPGGRSVCHE